jgi:hypothetical protein
LVLDEAHHIDKNVIDHIQPFLKNKTIRKRFIWMLTGVPSLCMYENMLPVLFPGVDVSRPMGRMGATATMTDEDNKEKIMPLGEFVAGVSVCVTLPRREDLIQKTEFVDLTSSEWDFLLKLRAVSIAWWHKKSSKCAIEDTNGNSLAIAGNFWSWGRARRIKALVREIRIQTPNACILVLSSFRVTIQTIRDSFDWSGIVHTQPNRLRLQKRCGGLLLVTSIASIGGLNLPNCISHVILAEPQTNLVQLSDILSHVYGDSGSNIQLVTVDVQQESTG